MSKRDSVSKTAAQADNTKHRQTVSFRPWDKVDDLLKAAEQAFGETPTDLCNEALLDFIPRFLAMKAADQKKLIDDVLKKFGPDGKAKS